MRGRNLYVLNSVLNFDFVMLGAFLWKCGSSLAFLRDIATLRDPLLIIAQNLIYL